ncbi:Nuclear body protein SP140-like protein [Myotis davidii]|uniref:Nuclear body protein SP140-like protein n=1 Tax=Myotis davidii TaxID=225400 RepID=L5M2U3_MYODS|nr:Nuclear body protein SP140-like protein [Myotis davidii]
MASVGSDLSTRMSVENKHIYDIALRHFKTQKVKISNIIKVAFPFLELLRDYGFISNEIYEKGEEKQALVKTVLLLTEGTVLRGVPCSGVNSTRDRLAVKRKSKESFKTPGSEQKVTIDVLNEVEKTFNLSLLEALFSKDVMDTYPGLNDIYKTFKKVIPNIEQFLKSDGEENEERPEQSLEQGPFGSGSPQLAPNVGQKEGCVRTLEYHSAESIK